ncbi:hypothetical protein TNIN_247721 [Trichonephila inaurata madagascariensis]|uniref:Uncharacterized protein n=1 Tax=Trichonephila inaurata madagascariensis TaxID=2747483 RepID=A0A8X6X423_9ARAC|nr:hypothetical protein TNIN_247721 [Trichonephila inaurata madagascariensis]
MGTLSVAACATAVFRSAEEDVRREFSGIPAKNESHDEGIFYSKGIANSKFIVEGRTVNKEHYLDILRHLKEFIAHKRLQMWKSGQ